MRIHLHHHLFSQLLMQFLSWWCNRGDNKLGQLGTLCPTAIKRLYTVPYTKQTWRSWCVCTPTHHAPLCRTWMHFVEALLSHSFSIKTWKLFRHRSWHLTVPALSPFTLSLSPSPPHDYLTRSTQCNLDDSIAFLADVTILLWLCSSISSFALSLMTAKVSIHPDEGYIHDRVIETSRLHLLGIFCSREMQKHHKCWNQNCHIQNECVCVCVINHCIRLVIAARSFVKNQWPD